MRVSRTFPFFPSLFPNLNEFDQKDITDFDILCSSFIGVQECRKQEEESKKS